MEVMDYKNRRRNYFIKREFQARFILKFCILVALTALISSVVIYRFSSESVTTVFENSRLLIKPSTEFIMPGLILSSFISVILVGIATVIVVLFVSHKIAGPLYKIEKSLGRIADGDLSFDVYLRKTDEAKMLAEAFNNAARSLNNLLGAAAAETAKLNDELDELKKLCDGIPPESASIKDSARRTGDIAKALTAKLNRFRLR